MLAITPKIRKGEKKETGRPLDVLCARQRTGGLCSVDRACQGE